MVLGDPFRKAIALYGSDDFRVAQDWSTKRLVGIRYAIKSLLNEVVRVVGCFSDFLQNHFAFTFDLVRWKGRVAHDVCQQINGHRRLITQKRQVVCGVIPGGPRIHGCANALCFKGDAPRVTPAGSFKRHVLHKMG